MNRKNRIHHFITLIGSLVSFFCMVFIMIRVNTNTAQALNIDGSRLSAADYILGFGHLYVIIFMIYAIILIFSHFRLYGKLTLLKTAVLTTGILSLFSMGVIKVMADEIARQYRAGMDIHEINILNLAYVINLVFAAVVFFYNLRSIQFLKDSSSEKKTVDEEIFTIAQFMGILSGVTGLLLTFSLVRHGIPEGRITSYIPFYLLFLCPYVLAVAYWLSMKIKQRIKDWYDEKQLQDVLKASLTTLLLSVPGLLVFLCLGIHSIIFFFLYYIFLVLALFSGSTLLFFKY